jgi:hypothetical protein
VDQALARKLMQRSAAHGDAEATSWLSAH